jgi:hypothetical protein
MENSRTCCGPETWAVGLGALYGACPNVGRQVALLQGPLNPAIERQVKMAMGVFKSEGWTWRCTGMYGRVEGGANSWIKQGFYEGMIFLFLWGFGLARDLKMQPW